MRPGCELTDVIVIKSNYNNNIGCKTVTMKKVNHFVSKGNFRFFFIWFYGIYTFSK